jgi:hypothetical protein
VEGTSLGDFIMQYLPSQRSEETGYACKHLVVYVFLRNSSIYFSSCFFGSQNVATGDSSVTNESPSGAGSSSDSAGNGSASTSGSADGGGGIKKTTKAD